MLINGPLGESRLVGEANNASEYLLGLLASLPYARAVQLVTKAGERSVAIELSDDLSAEETMTNSEQFDRGNITCKDSKPHRQMVQILIDPINTQLSSEVAKVSVSSRVVNKCHWNFASWSVAPTRKCHIAHP